MSKAKPRVLVFIDWFYPGYLAGGPVQSIVSLVEHFKSEIDLWVFTRDRDLNGKEAYPGIRLNEWQHSPIGCMVYYASPDKLGSALNEQILKEYPWDVVYINGLYSTHFSIAPLFLLKKKFRHLPFIIAPRGMLSKGALSLKPIKKKSYLLYAKYTGLYNRAFWHAASLQEENEIVSALGTAVPRRMIPNLPRRLTYSPKEEKAPGLLKLFYASRISPVKNTLFALETLSLVKIGRISLHLYGLIEDQEYWDKCLKLIARLPEHISVEYRGSYNAENAASVFARYQALFLPTLNENYGHSIVESLMSGCPVIISDQTPWKDLQQKKAGYALPLDDPQAFRKAIESYVAMDEQEFGFCRDAAISYIHNKIDIESILQQYRELFTKQFENGPLCL